MKGENPFTLTFGQKPIEFISRTDQIGKIINTFDMEKHLRRRPALVKSDEIFDYYEISESDLQEDTDHE
mgnify:CR=1 FL=1